MNFEKSILLFFIKSLFTFKIDVYISNVTFSSLFIRKGISWKIILFFVSVVFNVYSPYLFINIIFIYITEQNLCCFKNKLTIYFFGGMVGGQLRLPVKNNLCLLFRNLTWWKCFRREAIFCFYFSFLVSS